MRRILFFLLTTLFVASLNSFAMADPSKSSMKSSMKTAAMTKCPTGKTYIKPYKKKDGTKVAGYCRAATKAKK